jgi:predicted Zn finger-like uncharacterized protein
MEINCDKCGAKFNVPDEKIPKGKRVIISCPKCKNRLTVDSHGLTQEKAGGSAVGKTKPGVKRPDEGYAYGEEGTALEFYEEGVKLALVAGNNAEQVEKPKKAVEELGYRFVWAKNTREAIGKMRLHHFDLMILPDGFDGIGFKDSPLLQFLNHLSMSLRRRIFLALISDKFNTMDNMMAFAMSANLVVNEKDLDKLAAVLKKAISDHDKFYKVFMDTLVEEGKA